MGILKHAVLPLYAALLGFMGYQLLVAENVDDTDLKESWSGPDRDFDKVPLTTLEMHLLHFAGGTCIALAINAAVAVFKENAHYRAMAVLMILIVSICDVISYIKVDKPLQPFHYGVLGLGAVGLVIHSMEPGVFTKDKNAKSKTG